VPLVAGADDFRRGVDAVIEYLKSGQSKLHADFQVCKLWPR